MIVEIENQATFNKKRMYKKTSDAIDLRSRMRRGSFP